MNTTERTALAKKLFTELPKKNEAYGATWLRNEYTDDEHAEAMQAYQVFCWSGNKPEHMESPAFLGLIHYATIELTDNDDFLYCDLLLEKLARYLEPDKSPLVFYLMPSEKWWDIAEIVCELANENLERWN